MKNSNSFSTLLPEGSKSIVSPVPCLRWRVPDTGTKFRLEVVGLRLGDADDNFAAAISYDNRITWLNDTDNPDSYILYRYSDTAFIDSLGYLSPTAGGPSHAFGVSLFIDLFPGSDTEIPHWGITSVAPGAGAAGYIGVGTLNWSATVPPAPRRITDFLVQPYGNGSVLPIGGKMIVAGHWQQASY